MTIANNDSRIVFTGPGNGFSYARPSFEEDGSDIYLFLTNTATGATSEPVLDGAGTYDFTVTGTYDSSSARYASTTITLNNALPSADWELAVECRPIREQPDAYTNGGPLNMRLLETAFDRLWVTAKDLTRRVNSAFALAPTVTGVSGVLPLPEAGKLLGWNADEDALENKTSVDSTVIPSLTAKALLPLRVNAGASALEFAALDSTGLATGSVTAAKLGTASVTAVKVGTDLSTVGLGQCRLTLSGGSLLLSPYNGNLLTVNAAKASVPDAGAALAFGSLSNNTNYYIYAYLNAGVLTLEASTTAPVLATNYGYKIKTGDATRIFVGLARTATGAWDTGAAMTRSYFNRQQLRVQSTLTTDRTTASTSYVEVNSEIRANFRLFDDEIARVNVRGTFYNDTLNQTVAAAVAFNGTTAETGAVYSKAYAAGGAFAPLSLNITKSGLAEGSNHYATLLGAVVGSGDATFAGAATANTTTLEVSVG